MMTESPGVSSAILAAENDGSILSIAYDNTRSAPDPQRWDMRFVMGLAGFLGAFAIVRSLGMYGISSALLRMNLDTVRTMIYLNLFTLYAARTWRRSAGPMLASSGGYCALMFLVQDRMKLAGRRIFREERSGYFGRAAR
jgi:hypothetical protein